MSRIVFLDIDGPIIPYSMFLIERMCSWHRVIPAIPVAVVREICKRGDAKVVFNTTHNNAIDGVDDIEVAIVKAGLPEDMIHADMKTKYPSIPRDLAVLEWLSRHSEVTDWIALDDAKFTDKDNLIWVDPDAGLHLGHLNTALGRWGCPQFLVL
jgi:hypothetical protein